MKAKKVATIAEDSTEFCPFRFKEFAVQGIHIANGLYSPYILY